MNKLYRTAIGVTLLLALGGVIYLLNANGGSKNQVTKTNTEQTSDEALLPQVASAKYDELQDTYGSSQGAKIESCKNIDEHIYIVSGHGGFQGEGFYYEQSGKLLGNSFETDIANDPLNKPAPVDRNQYICTVIRQSKA
jgi:hypothetical protein